MKQASKETCERTFERVSGAHSFFKAAVYFKGFSNMDFINTLSIKISVFLTIFNLDTKSQCHAEYSSCLIKIQ